MKCQITILVLAVFLTRAAQSSPPQIFWASDPVRPNETVLVQGAGFGAAPMIEVGRLRDGGKNSKDIWALTRSLVTVKPLQVSASSLKFVLPQEFKPGEYAFRIREDHNLSTVTVLNAVDVWWIQGNEGQYATPGGWLRLFGKCLATGGKTQVRLKSAAGNTLTFKAKGDDYSARIQMPQDLVPGRYQVEMHNGCLGDAGWVFAGDVKVIPPVQWKQDVYKLSDFPGNPTAAMEAALEKATLNGGGIVLIPRGRWEMTRAIKIPAGTILKGESRELSSIYWLDFKNIPPVLIRGANFGIQDLSIYAQSFKTLLSVRPESRRLVLSNLLIRCDTFFGLNEPGTTFNRRTAPQKVLDGEARIFQINYPNFQITGCDIYSNARVLVLEPKGFVEPDGPRFSGLIAGNRICGGQGYSIEAADGVIFEDNDVSGSAPMTAGNSINSYFNNFVRNIYFGNNRIRDIYGAYREMMTLDASGSAYYGRVAQVEGTRITLATDPIFKDYKQHRTDYRGGAVVIMSGTGAGQYRIVTGNKDREWTIDRPWGVAPDASSIITITHHRGRNIFQGNDFADGGACQLYGAALDSLVVGNKGRRMSGFLVWGGNQGGMGWQPSMNCQFLDNEISEGNGYGYQIATIGTATSGIISSSFEEKLNLSQEDIEKQRYSGPLVVASVFRRNKIDSNGHYQIAGRVDNVLVENCRVSDSEQGIMVARTATDVLLRNNTFANVDKPLSGDGIGTACVVTEQSARPGKTGVVR